MEHVLTIGKYTLESLTNGMYASPLDMYREYIQNAVDSFDDAIAKRLVYTNKLKIEIKIDKEANTISIKDNGLGISKEKAVGTLLDIGNSKKSRSSYRGFRGIGRLAGLGYCDKLIFKTSYEGEDSASIVEFDAKMLGDLLIPSNTDSVSVNDVIEKIVTIRTASESKKKRYFEVILEGVSTEDGLTEGSVVKEYLRQHAPLSFDPDFKWQRTIIEKVRIEGYSIPQYQVSLNGEDLYKPYLDTFLSDRVKKSEDRLLDINVKTFTRNGKISAILWYGQSNFFGTITDNTIKGIRIRQGNILLGDKSSFGQFFKEERFNGWMIGELHVVDDELIANSRRDGFEKNTAFYELTELLKEWSMLESKEIRRISYERSLSSEKKAIVKAKSFEDVNGLCSELLDEIDYSEYLAYEQSESEEIAEIDYIGKLSMLLNQKKVNTKYIALNINDKLTVEQRKVLERVFDVISEEYSPKKAEEIINKIVKGF